MDDSSMAESEIDIHQLMRRLAQCPGEIYDFTGMNAESPVPLAQVQDTIYYLGGPALEQKARKSVMKIQTERPVEAAFLMLGCYVLSDPLFCEKKELVSRSLSLLVSGFTSLADLAQARDFVLNTERREELVRLCLKHLELRPEGESKDVFKNRWESLDSVRRVELMQKATELRKRQEELRKAMERKAAEEAASKWSRE